jgi:hypothetical protein
MHRLVSRLAALAAAIAITVATTTAANADPWGGVNCELTPEHPRCTVEVTYVGGGGGTGGSDGGNLVCKVGGEVVECHNGFGWLGSDGCYYGKDSGGFLPPNEWIRHCIDAATGNLIYRGVVYVPRPPVALAVITDRAIDRLTMPKPVIAANPSLAARQFVHVPVWWWVQPAGGKPKPPQPQPGG